MSERELIDRIRKNSTQSADDLIRGIGDDCSVFGSKGKTEWLVSTDMLVDTFHFDRTWHDPKLLGRKCIAVNLSDIAAMGGDPRFVLLSVSVPKGFSSEWIEIWFEGVKEILAEFNCLLIGGDTVTGKELNFSITVIGTPSCERVLYRDGAKEGDLVYVSGTLGNSAAGLLLCKNYGDLKEEEQNEAYRDFYSAHLDPIPQVELGKLLCRSGYVSAMQDISDGLATDLSHICHESNVRAIIQEDKLPCLPVIDKLCDEQGVGKLDLIIRGGEDYQLVFTVSRDSAKELEKHAKTQQTGVITCVGEICKGRGVQLRSQTDEMREITFQGYEHYL